MKKILCAVLLACSTLVWGADDSIALRLQKGLFEEEANHNLPAAIEQYKAVITATDEQRKLAATALFRLGESYHKLGREEEAKEAYSRVIRDFSDQKEIATKASERISTSTPPVVSTARNTPEIATLQRGGPLLTIRSLQRSPRFWTTVRIFSIQHSPTIRRCCKSRFGREILRGYAS
jgi:tetratricopeptide (TPR) repeat protein